MNHNRIKILFLIPSLGGGGAERVVINLLRNMDRSKFEMGLAILNTNSAVYLNDVPKDIDFIVIGSSRVRFAAAKIFKLIKNRKPDIVFSTLGHLNLLIAMLKPFLPKDTYFIGRGDNILSITLKQYPNPSIWRLAYRSLYGRFDRIVCQSKFMRDDLIENFGLPPEKLTVINNPVDVTRIRELAVEPVNTTEEKTAPESTVPNKTINLVAVGRLMPQKGFDLLLEALSLCKKNHFHLTLMGNGPELSNLQTLAETLNVADQVTFLGFQKNPYPYIAGADAYVLSSRYEGFPNVVLEALACCTPVIATPEPGGVKEILGGMEGCLIAEEISAASLAKALDNFQYGARLSPSQVEPYAMSVIVEKYQNQFFKGME